MGAPDTIMVPCLGQTPERTLTTGHTDEAVVLMLGSPVSVVQFAPTQARQLAAKLLELADDVDGGRGVS